MELREWLIILGLALVTLIVVDGVRRLQRQRRVPRLDQVDTSSRESEQDPEAAAREAEIEWELPNGGARVLRPADYSGVKEKPKLKRQEHPGPSKVLSEFRHSFGGHETGHISPGNKPAGTTEETPQATTPSMASRPVSPERPSPAPASVTSPTSATTASSPAAPASEKDEPRVEREVAETDATMTAFHSVSEGNADTERDRVRSRSKNNGKSGIDSIEAQAEERVGDIRQEPRISALDEQEPTMAADMADDDSPTLAPKSESQASEANASRPRRQLRSNTVGNQPAAGAAPDQSTQPQESAAPLSALEDDELQNDEYDDEQYRLVDFEGMGHSLKKRMLEHRQARRLRKEEKARRAQEAAKLKAERKALEAQKRRDAEEAAQAERARQAQEAARQQEQAQREEAAAREQYAYEQELQRADDDHNARSAADGWREERLPTHPTMEKALRNDVDGNHARDTLTHAEEVVVISVISRDPDGFPGAKLLELMMACGLRYSSDMGVFHRFETESPTSELQFSMLNVIKPGTFALDVEEDFTTPGITLLMPLPGALDSSAAFEAMVETAMVVVRHMGGELKDENHSVMTAQTIEFARQRVHEFERRHRLSRQLHAH
ncbi:cell division protein ZipA [Halomonas sp. Bachu 37]|uniref:cell division protein ZipA n=1 Tax=Halomonas kashgarensis TaxID=3084920 RepID=UPI003217681C